MSESLYLQSRNALAGGGIPVVKLQAVESQPHSSSQDPHACEAHLKRARQLVIAGLEASPNDARLLICSQQIDVAQGRLLTRLGQYEKAADFYVGPTVGYAFWDDVELDAYLSEIALTDATIHLDEDGEIISGPTLATLATDYVTYAATKKRLEQLRTNPSE